MEDKILEILKSVIVDDNGIKRMICTYEQLASQISNCITNIQSNNQYVSGLNDIHTIKIGDSKIKIVCDKSVPKNEVWFVDWDGGMQRVKYTTESVEVDIYSKLYEQGPEIVKRGILDMQVCVPKEWTDEQVIQFAERENPCGTSLGWAIRREGNKSLMGQPERNRCSERKNYVHIMLEC